MRILNLIVAVVLILAAAYVYKIKFEATLEAEQVAKLRTEITRERDATAALRAEAAKLENPARIQDIAQRHFSLRLLDPAQIDTVESLPMRPTEPLTAAVPELPAASPDPGAAEGVTGSVRPARRQP